MNETEDILEAYKLVLINEGLLNKVASSAALAAGSLMGAVPNADAGSLKDVPPMGQSAQLVAIPKGKYVTSNDFKGVQSMPAMKLTEDNYKKYISSYIKNKEGFRKAAYIDPSGEGKWCVGYGFELNGNAPQVAKMRELGLDYKSVKAKKQFVTEDQATKLLDWYIEHQAIADATDFFPDFPNLHPNIKAALIDLSYNNGLPRMLKYKGLKAALVRKDYVRAAFEYIDTKEYAKCIANHWGGKIDRLNKAASLIYSVRGPQAEVKK